MPALLITCTGAVCRVPDDCTYEEAQLVRDCLQNEPDERPSAKDLVNRLAGASNRPNSLLSRGSGSMSGGHISGQLLADGRCAGTISLPVRYWLSSQLLMPLRKWLRTA